MDKNQRMQAMLEVWYIDIEQMMNDNAANQGEMTRISKLKLLRIKREINEEIEEYGK